MRVAFVGLGSIGRRHLSVCQKLRPEFEYAALRSQKGAAPSGIRDFYSVQELKQWNPELVFVCTPTAHHAKAVQELASVKPAFFIEKPLAHRSDDLKQMRNSISATGQGFFYGAVFRFHPLVKRVAEVLAAEKSKVLSYSFYCGSYLPGWRPDADYRKSYSAHSELGGGVTLDLIHEFDLAEFLMGPIGKLTGYKAKLSSLEITSDDTCVTNLAHRDGVLGQISLNYTRQTPRRDFEIVLDKGWILGDLLTGKLTGFLNQKNISEAHSIERNDLFALQASSVFDSLQSKSQTSGSYLKRLDEVVALNQKVLEIPFLKKEDLRERS